MMYGIYMRLDLLMHENNRKQLLAECKHYFLTMAKTTGTLWENNLPSASCNHGFASYSIGWLVYALTGLDLLNKNQDYNLSSFGINLDLVLPISENRFLHITIKDNEITPSIN